MVVTEASDFPPDVLIDFASAQSSPNDERLEANESPTADTRKDNEKYLDKATSAQPEGSISVTCRTGESDSSTTTKEESGGDETSPSASVRDGSTGISLGADHQAEVEEKHSKDLDAGLIAQANDYLDQERLLEAARALRKVQDVALFQEKHWKALQKAQHVEAAVVDLTSSPDHGWTKQGESHGSYDTIIYYKVDKATRLTARIETPIDASLLVPLLSVFNESELYETWIPHMNGLGVSQSIKLRQTGRGNQIIAVTSYLPWPLADREVIIEATAVDDISANNHIVVKMQTRYEGEEGGVIPPPKSGVVRADFDGGILFRKCPEDHAAFAKSKRHASHKGPMVLVCFTMFADAHVKYVPQKLINFVTRTVLGLMWSSLLTVAQDIRDGKRPQHAEAIASKRELYEWVEQRIEVMIANMDETERGQQQQPPVK